MSERLQSRLLPPEHDVIATSLNGLVFQRAVVGRDQRGDITAETLLSMPLVSGRTMLIRLVFDPELVERAVGLREGQSLQVIGYLHVRSDEDCRRNPEAPPVFTVFEIKERAGRL
jgi:hypothetical protein